MLLLRFDAVPLARQGHTVPGLDDMQGLTFSWSESRGFHACAKEDVKKGDILLTEQSFRTQVDSQFAGKFCCICAATIQKRQGTKSVLRGKTYRICAPCSSAKTTAQVLTEALHMVKHAPRVCDDGMMIGAAVLHQQFTKALATKDPQLQRLLLLPWSQGPVQGMDTSLVVFFPLETKMQRQSAWFEAIKNAEYNQYTIEDGHEKIGTAIFPAAAMIDHSCCPNASAKRSRTDNGAVITIVATRTIRKGQEILCDYASQGTISDPVNGFSLSAKKSPAIRQFLLRRMFRFTCSCERCSCCWRCGKKGSVNCPCGGTWCSLICRTRDEHHTSLCGPLVDVQADNYKILKNE